MYMANPKTSAAIAEDLSWPEVFQLGKKYMKIPFALLCVEIFYWFITQPSDTLVPIQMSEAWIWNELTNLIYGEGTATLTAHNGWMTQVNLYNSNFPGKLDTVALYVSDECAGVHEMIFISTLIMMTEGVPQKLKIRSVIVMCTIVYVLNIVRLVAFYPIAASDCHLDPNNPVCLTGMWNFHEAIYKWGFLLLLVMMWLVWFRYVGGPSKVLNSKKNNENWKISIRSNWGTKHFLVMGFVVMMICYGIFSITTNEIAMDAKETLDFCSFSKLSTGSCIEAQNTWDNAIDTSWSLSAIGVVIGALTVFQFEKKNLDGKWPSEIHEEE